MAATTIALLAFVAFVGVAAEVCVEKSRGLLMGIKHDQVHILAAGQHNYEIELPSPCFIKTTGVKVHVCDPDAPHISPPPVLTLPSLHRASVFRYTSQNPATLTATFYCLVGRSGIDVVDESQPAVEYQGWSNTPNRPEIVFQIP